MERLFTSPPWSIELAPGWNAERRVEDRNTEHDEYVAVVPATGDALLRFTTRLFPARSGDNAEQWVETVANSTRVRGLPVSSVTCGDFNGYLTYFAAGAESLCGWVLCCGSFVLDVSYTCDVQHRGRDYSTVQGMLNTLRFHGPAAE